MGVPHRLTLQGTPKNGVQVARISGVGDIHVTNNSGNRKEQHSSSLVRASLGTGNGVLLACWTCWRLLLDLPSSIQESCADEERQLPETVMRSTLWVIAF